ncbi:hypothetical protein lerEdw1_015500 [Lerista edwardsae]|nr:hypothetical protein lerEdw1_015500 [Lerista edwardsae]
MNGRLSRKCPLTIGSAAWTLLLSLHFFWVGRIRSASIPLPEGPHALRILQTTVFQSPSMTDFEIIAFLGDVETHSVDSRTGKISFLQPWANSSLSPREWLLLQMITKTYLIGFNRTIHAVLPNISYPAVAQSLIFCEIQPNGTTRGFYDAAGNGEAFLTFSADTGVWAAQKKDPAVLRLADFLNQDKGTVETLQHLFSQCIRSLNTFLQTGKTAVERQEHPVVAVFAHHESPTGPDSLLLVCRVTSFYPRPIKVSWLQDDQEMPNSSMVNSTQILPNHDLTYQIRSSLVIPSTDAHSYSCKVEHSSLGGKSLVIPWGKSVGRGLKVFAGEGAAPNTSSC